MATYSVLRVIKHIAYIEYDPAVDDLQDLVANIDESDYEQVDVVEEVTDENGDLVEF